MQSDGSHSDNLLRLSTGVAQERQNGLGLESLTALAKGGKGLDKFGESLSLEKYGQVVDSRLDKYNGDTSRPDLDNKYMSIDKFGRETSCNSGMDKYRERFRQDRCRYANDLVREQLH